MGVSVRNWQPIGSYYHPGGWEGECSRKGGRGLPLGWGQVFLLCWMESNPVGRELSINRMPSFVGVLFVGFWGSGLQFQFMGVCDVGRFICPGFLSVATCG